ncbi:MAG: NAD-dependent epimerase/dehydratase family protein [Deltaproteobacteria bacterium]|nr:MAG: NAD-dependent epimerase/dehydratase family protein [Deltaproteobacteria bacterium]
MKRAFTEDGECPDERVLVTGFPAFTARRMAAKILAEDATARLDLLVRDKFVAAARDFIASLPSDQAARIEPLIGDVCDMDLGLAGGEFARIAAEVTTIWHMAGIYFHGVDRHTARRVNVEGTRGVIELAKEARQLRRLCHWSTATVSGKRRGVVMEDELDENQSFHNFYEETKFEAEKLARAAQRHLPVTVFRPGIIVGDSRTGEIDKFDGPYYLAVLFVTTPPGVRLPLPGRGAAPLHVAPIDYVIDAAYALSLDARAAGKTFHLTDPNPLSARRVYALIAEQTRRTPAQGFIPSGLARALLHTPGIERIARGPLAFLDALDHLVFYNTRNTRELLAGTGIDCPPFDTYVAALVRYVRDVHDARRAKLEDDVFDPFD